jgi:16S rRNA (guanine966-N2)-methyltransferase
VDGEGMSGRPPGSVRIVAGSRRGRRIRVLPAGGTRPTSDRVREAIFSALGPIGDLHVLDLFAGSGALGLEALSRGARSCVLVENDPAAAAVLRENAETLEYQDECRILETGYERALKILSGRGSRFDLLFVDPPYRMLAEVEVMVAPLLPSVMSVDGVVVIEGHRTSQVTLGQAPVFDRVYGDTRVTMIRMRRSIR